MIIGLLALMGLFYILFFIVAGAFELIKAIFGGLSSLHQDNVQGQRAQQQQQRIDYMKRIAPEGWKYHMRIYFVKDNDVKAFHCHNQAIHFFTDGNKVIETPESDINDMYYLINIEITPTNDAMYTDLRHSILTFITTDKTKVIKVTPTIPERSVMFLKEHFLLTDSEKKARYINPVT